VDLLRACFYVPRCQRPPARDIGVIFHIHPWQQASRSISNTLQSGRRVIFPLNPRESKHHNRDSASLAGSITSYYQGSFVTTYQYLHRLVIAFPEMPCTKCTSNRSAAFPELRTATSIQVVQRRWANQISSFVRFPGTKSLDCRDDWDVNRLFWIRHKQCMTTPLGRNITPPGVKCSWIISIASHISLALLYSCIVVHLW